MLYDIHAPTRIETFDTTDNPKTTVWIVNSEVFGEVEIPEDSTPIVIYSALLLNGYLYDHPHLELETIFEKDKIIIYNTSTRLPVLALVPNSTNK